MKIKIVTSTKVNPLINIANTMNSGKIYDIAYCLDACTCTGNCEE